MSARRRLVHTLEQEQETAAEDKKQAIERVILKVEDSQYEASSTPMIDLVRDLGECGLVELARRVANGEFD